MPESVSTSQFTPEVARRLRAIGIASILLGLLSSLICVLVLMAEHHEMAQIERDQLQRANAYSHEFQDRKVASEIISSISGIELGVTLLQLVAAVMLMRPAFWGVVLHRIYAMVQLPGNVVMSAILISLMLDTPADMIFYIGAIPGLILSIFPVAVLFMLRGVGKPQTIGAQTGERET
jgi:hypothetical protein